VLWKTDSVSAPCGRLPGEGIHSPTYYRWKRQLDRHGPEILTQSPYRNVPLPKIQREEMRFLTPAEVVDLAEAIHARYRASCSSAPTAACGWASWPGSAKGRIDLLAEILTEVKGKLIAGPSKTRAGRRTVGLPPFVVRELEAHLAAAQRPSGHVFTAPVGAAVGPELSSGSWVPATKAAGLQGLHITIFATPPWRCDRRRCDAQGGRRARGAHLGQLDPGPLRPPDDPRPVAEGHPVRD